jgi:hypothetical protein
MTTEELKSKKAEVMRRNRLKGLGTAVCKACGKTFTKNNSNSTCCSKACYDKANRKGSAEFKKIASLQTRISYYRGILKKMHERGTTPLEVVKIKEQGKNYCSNCGAKL